MANDVKHGQRVGDGREPNSGGIVRRDALKAVAALAAAPLSAQIAGQPTSNSAYLRDQPFDDGWLFLRDDAPGAEQPVFDDREWRALDLPHDWSVEDLPQLSGQTTGAGKIWDSDTLPTRIGPFDIELSQGGRSTGWFVGGTGWYRKRFAAPEVSGPDQVEIVFDGVYMNCDVWLNGNHLGNHPYGYTAFAFDLTPHLRRDEENVLAVRVRNEGRNSRWYSGSGIYRHVWLNVTGGVRFRLWGVFVTTPVVSVDRAVVRVEAEVENREQVSREAVVRFRLLDPEDRPAGMGEAVASLEAGSAASVDQEFDVAVPELWSLERQPLYRVEAELVVGQTTVDRMSIPVGIRSVEIDARHGLWINAEPVLLKGACMHHDNGLLGALAIDRAEERRVELMKAAGFNAIRTAHNPPSRAFLDACDRLGMLVMDEAFDCWERRKNPQDYHLYFSDWWERDIDSMVRRDRNHPSVILWSIGNEIPERGEPEGVELARLLRERILSQDSTRAITAGVNGIRGLGPEGLDPAFEHLDVAGYNYLWAIYESDHERKPERVTLGTESFAQLAFENWDVVERNPYVIGDFVWTGMDHLGESAIGNAQLGESRGRGNQTEAPNPPGVAPNLLPGIPPFGNIALDFPWFNCYCGDIDLIGERKPQLLYRQVLWGESDLEVLVQRPVPSGRTETITAWGWSDELPSWTWPGHENEMVKVRVYSTGDQVRLLLNDQEIGVQPESAETRPRTEFEVPYAAGELRAVALAGGQTIAEKTLRTVGPPARLRLRADRVAIGQSRNDLSYVTVEVLDEGGQLVPDATVEVALSVDGVCELAAAGSANPKDVYSFRSESPRTFHGRCLAILRPVGEAGSARLRAEAVGLEAASISITVG